MMSGTESPPSERSDGRKAEGEMYRQLSKQLLGKGEDSLGNELSAPYEVPQFPIEQIEQKLHKVRSDGPKLNKQTSVDANLSSPGAALEAWQEEEEVDLSELIPDFQRVKISGEDNTGVPVEDLLTASHLLVRALAIREKYISASHQEFPSNVDRYLATMNNEPVEEDAIINKATIAGSQTVVSSRSSGGNYFLMKEIANI